MKQHTTFSSTLTGTLLGLCMGFSSASYAFTPATSPLFLSNQADPNVFFEIDDSGSMDWEILAKPHISPGFGTTLSNGLMYEGGSHYEYYLYSNSDNAYTTTSDWISTDWRARCSCLNVLAYDPTVTYAPWEGYPDADISVAFQARSNPHLGESGYSVIRNLNSDVYYTNWVDTNSDGVVDTGEPKTTVNTSSLTTIEQQNYANWYQYHRRRSFVAKGAVTAVIKQNQGFRYGLSVLNNWGSLFINVPSAGTTNYTSHNNSLINSLNSLNWPTSGTPLRSALKRTGDYFDNTLSGKPDPIISECQKNFAVLFTDGYWNGGSPSVGNIDSDGHSDTLADVARRYYDTDLSPLADNVPPDTFDTNARQHMVTFTVAFGINGLLTDTDADGWPNPALTESANWGNPFNSNAEKVDDLWHAAYNGKGTFIAAQSPQDVANSINAALANIAGRTSSAASVALNAGSIGANSRLYQAKFDTDKWSGQILSFTVNPSGTVNTTPNWDAGCKITGGLCPTTGSTETSQHWDTGRNIITYKPSTGDGIPFRWPANPATPTATELDVAQTSALDIDFATALSDGNGMLRWQYLRGSRTGEGTTFRARDSVLGDVIHSAPLYIATPSFNFPDSLESAPYSAFRTAYQSRTPMIWFGSNDGMFHGVNADLSSTNQGKEIIAYVPSESYKHLNELPSTSYSHRYYVDGAPAVSDVFYSSSWKTVIVSGLAAGGQGLFALDVTNPSTFTEANANSMSLWEFTDQDDADLGYTYSKPSIVKLPNGTWAAIFGNGYGNQHNNGSGSDSTSGNAVIYIVDISNGSIIKKFDTGVGTAQDPQGLGRTNGMSSTSVIDVDDDKVADYIYAGDLFGNMWKIDLAYGQTSSARMNAANWAFDYSTSAPHTPIFVATDSLGVVQPITTAPEISKHPKGGFLINFGTGKYIETVDNTQIGQQTQTFYGVWDKNLSTLASYNRSHMLQQKFTVEQSEDFDVDQDTIRSSGEGTTEVRKSTKTPITWHIATGLPSAGNIATGVSTGIALGWFIDLYNTQSGNTNNYGERQVTNANIIDGVIVFNTLIPSPNPCDFGGDSWIVALKADSGERVDESVFDLDQNGVYDAADGFNDAGNTRVTATKSKVGILAQLTFAVSSTGDSYLSFGSGSTSGIMGLGFKPSDTLVMRQSWDQIQE